MNKYFEFDTKAKVLSGEKALSHVNYELLVRGKKYPFIMSDAGLDSLGITDKAIKAMNLEKFEKFVDIPVDSSTETVNIATKKYKEAGCDCIIAVGGGSVIDTAKGVVLSIVSGKEDIAEVEGAEALVKENNVLFIAVPTTAGTGSEMTSVAVIKDAKQGAKLEYISSFILPDISVLDPEMTLSLPAKITASTAVDALTHCIEAYSCLQKNPISDAYAVCGIKIISENLLKLVSDLKNKELRLNVANGALVAGSAFSNSMVGAVHSIGHALGAVCHVAHGDAMSILLAYVLDMNFEKCKKYYGELLYFMNPEKVEKGQTDEQRARLFIDEVRALLEKLHEQTGLPIRLSQTGKVEKENFNEIAKKAMADGSALVNPVALSEERVVEILEKAF